MCLILKILAYIAAKRKWQGFGVLGQQVLNKVLLQSAFLKAMLCRVKFSAEILMSEFIFLNLPYIWAMGIIRMTWKKSLEHTKTYFTHILRYIHSTFQVYFIKSKPCYLPIFLFLTALLLLPPSVLCLTILDSVIQHPAFLKQIQSLYQRNTHTYAHTYKCLEHIQVFLKSCRASDSPRCGLLILVSLISGGLLCQIVLCDVCFRACASMMYAPVHMWQWHEHREARAQPPSVL